MKPLLSGFTFIRNGVRFDYPFIESIRSMLPLVDELVIAVGDSDDGTREQVERLKEGRIRIIDTQWDPARRSGGLILSDQTNIALDHAHHPWALYLQGDEVLHENDRSILLKAFEKAVQDDTIEGLLFDYLHFYGSYRLVGTSRRWYRKEVRVVRTGIGVRSWGDAQGFRKDGRKLRVAGVPATVYHYGWVRPPRVQQEKLRAFHRLWHEDEWVEKELRGKQEYIYDQGGILERFDGSHPAVMRPRVELEAVSDPPASRIDARPLRHRILDGFERLTGVRLGEYRNYDLVTTFDELV